MIRKGGKYLSNYQIGADKRHHHGLASLSRWMGWFAPQVIFFCIFCLIALQAMSSSSTFPYYIITFLLPKHNLDDQPYGMIFSFWLILTWLHKSLISSFTTCTKKIQHQSDCWRIWRGSPYPPHSQTATLPETLSRLVFHRTRRTQVVFLFFLFFSP